LGPGSKGSKEQELGCKVGVGCGYGVLEWDTGGVEVLTPRISPQDKLSDLIIDEDEETVGEGTEPPSNPESSGGEGQEPQELAHCHTK
jgi:hypothetical protein